MSAKIIDGKKMALEIRGELKSELDLLKKQGVTPGLGVLLVGNDPASRSYVTAKEKACEKLGIYSDEKQLPETAFLKDILEVVEAYNRDNRIHGILVQLPLPNGAMEEEVMNAINPKKDVDGFHPVNVGRMMLGTDAFLPCTPHGILRMLKRAGISTNGAHVVVVGRSNIVGRPLANLLSQKSALGNATVTLCHTGTKDLASFTLQADIIIAATGRPNTISGEMIKPGAAIIDVGVNRVDAPDSPRGYRLVGDVDFDAVLEKASAITPVPGGVGPMTITMLLYNTIQSARASFHSHKTAKR